MKTIKICLWIGVGVFAAWGALLIISVLRGTESLPNSGMAFAVLILMFAALAAGAIRLSNRWPLGLPLAALILLVAFPVAFFGAFWYGAGKDAAKQRALDQQMHSGKQPVAVVRLWSAMA